MKREDAKIVVKGYLGDYLRNKGINIGTSGRKLFKCLNPDHTDKHPSMSYNSKENYVKCFSCGKSYDIFDLIGIEYGLTEDKDKFNKAYELYNIEIDSDEGRIDKGRQEHKELMKKKEAASQEEKVTDFTAFFLSANKDIEKPEAVAYLNKRGLSLEVAKRYCLGYVKEWKHPKAPKSPTSPRLIIPVTKYSYLARDIRDEVPEEQQNFTKPKVKGKEKVSWVFNSKALQTAQKPIFVVEGEIDALSIIEVGGEAVAIGSTAYYNGFLEAIDEHKPTQPLIISLDNDEAGQKADKEITEGLAGREISFYRHNIAGTHKDANEALLSDREGFTAEIRKAEQEQEEEVKAQEETERETYLHKSAAYCLQDFQREIEETAEAPAVSTGFYELDSILEGGLFPGLYFIGAVSSLGKTSFCLQIADQIAKSGKDVILFSLEMARSELMAKSISRLTYLNAQDKHQSKTTRGILAGSRYKGYTETEKALIEKAKGIYKDYASHIFIYEGVGDIGVDQIKATIQEHIAITKNRPIVFIDYLQILAPYDMRASDKQNTDKAVLELKRLSRDYKIPIVAISSFNRDSYTQPVNMAAFKESGAVEYSSDVLIGLQYEGMDYREGEKENERNKRIRELIARQEDQGRKGEAQNIQLKILKNRNGSKGQLLFNFISMFNYYQERDNGFLYLNDSVDMDEIFNNMRKK